MLLLSLKTLRAGRKRLIAILESNKVIPCPLPFLAYTLTSYCLEKTGCVDSRDNFKDGNLF
jgi:hypothetical protein